MTELEQRIQLLEGEKQYVSLKLFILTLVTRKMLSLFALVLLKMQNWFIRQSENSALMG